MTQQNENRTLAVRSSQSVVEKKGDLISSFDDVMRIAQQVANSKLFGCENAAQAVVKILAGREMGFEPIVSMTSIHVIEGKPSPGAELIAAAIRRKGSGYDYDVDERSDDVCQLSFFRVVGGERAKLGSVRYTLEEAKKKSWHLYQNGKPKMTWLQHPGNMLFARAMIDGKRFYCPDVMTAVCDADEMEPTEFTVRPTLPAPQTTAPTKVVHQKQQSAVSPRAPTRMVDASDPFDPVNDPERATPLVVNDDGSLRSPLDDLQDEYTAIESAMTELGFTPQDLKKKLSKQYGVETLREILDINMLRQIKGDLDAVRARRQKAATATAEPANPAPETQQDQGA